MNLSLGISAIQVPVRVQTEVVQISKLLSLNPHASSSPFVGWWYGQVPASHTSLDPDTHPHELRVAIASHRYASKVKDHILGPLMVTPRRQGVVSKRPSGLLSH